MVPRARIELALPKKPDFESGAVAPDSCPPATLMHPCMSSTRSIFLHLVPRARIELALPKEPDFESGASTNSATPAILKLSILLNLSTHQGRAGSAALGLLSFAAFAHPVRHLPIPPPRHNLELERSASIRNLSDL